MTRLNDSEIQTIVSRILATKLLGTGYLRAETKEDKDYDGEPIIRIRVYFNHPISDSEPLIQSSHAIREELFSQGDDRYVFISPEDTAEADVGVEDDDDGSV